MAACRFCGSPLEHSVVDLGMSPLCETYLSENELNKMEPFYPLHTYVCDRCWLVQLEEYVTPEHIFRDYPYYSSYSESWLAHAKAYAENMEARFDLGPETLVVELGSNDGYLLQFFQARAIPVLGVEPAANVAQDAISKGIPTRVEFFSSAFARQLAEEGVRPALIAGNNVLAQVPDVNDFVRGMAMLLDDSGVVTIEFPHLERMIEMNQFDTIYHEHFSYFSLLTAREIFATHGLTIFDVDRLPSHGGSLRVYARHHENTVFEVTEAVNRVIAQEREVGLCSLEYYQSFGDRVSKTKNTLLQFLISLKDGGCSVAGYGAPGKGNTLLNYCGIRSDLLPFTVDKNPNKQGRFLPGSHIPIHAPSRIDEARPDHILILPWNLKREISSQLEHARRWGARFVVPIPTVELL